MTARGCPVASSLIVHIFQFKFYVFTRLKHFENVDCKHDASLLELIASDKGFKVVNLPSSHPSTTRKQKQILMTLMRHGYFRAEVLIRLDVFSDGSSIVKAKTRSTQRLAFIFPHHARLVSFHPRATEGQRERTQRSAQRDRKSSSDSLSTFVVPHDRSSDTTVQRKVRSRV